MDGTFYALGPNGRYMYNAEKRWAWCDLPGEFEALREECVRSMICASFADKDEDYFFLFDDKKTNDITYVYSEDCAPELVDWIKNTAFGHGKDAAAEVRVVLGPKKSFVAWSPDSIIWRRVPVGLEKALQSWLSPAGWKVGPPRMVALGHGGAFFALSQFGAYAYKLPGEWPSARKAFSTYQAVPGFSWSSIHVFAVDELGKRF